MRISHNTHWGTWDVITKDDRVIISLPSPEMAREYIKLRWSIA